MMATYDVTFEVEVIVTVEAESIAEAEQKAKAEIRADLSRHGVVIGGVMDWDCLDEEDWP